MAKTTFSSGVIVTSQWLNGAQQIYFDGQDLDWHYPPLGLDSLVTGGPNGLDSRYVTLATSQPVLTPITVTIPDPADPSLNITYTSYRVISGSAISGDKISTGYWAFGSDPNVIGNPPNNPLNAPLSFTTNDKYNNANGATNPSIAQKYAALIPADLITKEILTEQIAEALDFLEIDNGFYYYEDGSGAYVCNNYSIPGSTPDPLSTDFVCGT